MINEFSYGAVVYRYKANQREFLLVKHQNGGHFGFPKGHIERHEEPIETAYREVYEETNIKTYLYKDFIAYSRYQINESIHKEVAFFIGKPLNDDMVKQDEEVSEVIWCNESDVNDKLTHDSSKMIFKELLSHINDMDEGVPTSLYSYVESFILPQYDHFDKGHHRDHIYEVVKASFDLVKQYPVRKDMIYLIACFHDLGLQFGRDTHHITSGDLLRKDPYVKQHYNQEDIEMMVEAIFDHRASNEHEPRSLYGKILAEADRLLDAKKVIERTVQYELHKHPNIDREEQIKHAFDHIIDKYGQKGYLKRYLDYEPNRLGEEELIRLSSDQTLLYETLKQAFDKIYK